MGDIGIFKPRISWTDFRRSIASPDLQSKVTKQLAVAIQGNQRHTYQIQLPNIDPARIEVDTPAGVMYGLPNTVGKIVTNEQFPIFLSEQGILKEDALQLAAASVVAFAWLDGKIKMQSGIPRSLRDTLGRKKFLPAHPRIWPAGEVNAGMQTTQVGVHRFAARIALDVCGIEDIDVSLPLPLPVHIAALLDPMPSEVLNVITNDVLYIERGGPNR